MSTVSLAIFTGPYPSITVHDVTINVYYESAPLAIVATLTHPAPHLVDTWNFSGLNRVNLLFRIFETNGGTIVQQLGGDMNVVPGAQGGVNFKTTEQITADTTIGFTSGVNTVTFDGTGGKEDWRTWDISTLNRMGGAGDLKKGVDYSWNINTGQLQLLATGDVFGPAEWYNVDFVPQATLVTSSSPTTITIFNTPQLITANYSVNAGSDFGGLLLVDPSGVYLELQLPDIVTVVPGRILEIEMRRATVAKTAKIKTAAGQTIDWLAGGRNSLYICPQESISIYRDILISGPNGVWRVRAPHGNWLRLGESVEDDNTAANVFNKLLYDGSSLDTQAYARLYNDYVLQLPGGQVVNYDDWTTGNNKYFFSLANSSVGANAGKFMIPDRRNTFERNTDGTRLPGAWQTGQLLTHFHGNGIADDKAPGDPGNVFNYGQTVTGLPGAANGNVGNSGGGATYQGITSTVGGSEGRPDNIAKRKYLLA